MAIERELDAEIPDELAIHAHRQSESDMAELRLELIDQIISALPADLQNEEKPIKACGNCANLGVTCIKLGLYWARERCKYCFDNERYGLWGHIESLRKECVGDLLHPIAPDVFKPFYRA